MSYNINTIRSLSYYSATMISYWLYVQKVIPLKFQGNVTPKLSKTFNKNKLIDTFIVIRVTDGQKIKQR